jgi:N-acylneuraminate cytidylyltransferase
MDPDRKPIALIPMRGGSKGIPKKNIKLLHNRPLCDWVIKSAIDSNIFDQIWVTTDDEEIARISKQSGAKVHMRDPQTATDNAPTSLAITDFITKQNISLNTNLFLIQATSPFTLPSDFQKAHKLYCNNKADGLVTCINMHHFRWGKHNNILGQPLNYNIYNRPRRQDWEGEYIEDGSFYILKLSEFMKTKGIPPNNNTAIYVMPHSRPLEIDEPLDFVLMETLAKNGYGYQKVSSKYVISLDIGGTNIRSGIVKDNNVLNYQRDFSDNKDNNLMDKINAHVKRQKEYAQLNGYNITGIGISTGGIVDPDTNTIHESVNIDNWNQIVIPKYIDDLPVRMQNDGNCSLLAEIKKNNLDVNVDNIVVMTIGTGVGIGISINGKIINNSECGKIFEEILSGPRFDSDNLQKMEKLAIQFANELVKLTELLCLNIIIINGFVKEYTTVIKTMVDHYNNNLRGFYKCQITVSDLNNQGLIGAHHLF